MMFRLPQLLIESCNACQNRCKHCAHQGMRDEDPTYQMPLEDIQALVDHFLKINCKIGNVVFHGPAEPLLWRCFNDAVRLIHGGGIVDANILDNKKGIQAVTNGKLLHVIADDVWDKITLLAISVYDYSVDAAILNRHPDKYECLHRPTFAHVKPEMFPYLRFSVCGCAGPMYYKGMIYPYCGPPIFDACLRSGTEHRKFCMPLNEYNPATPVKTPYESFLPCYWCWANMDIPKEQSVHQTY